MWRYRLLRLFLWVGLLERAEDGLEVAVGVVFSVEAGVGLIVVRKGRRQM